MQRSKSYIFARVSPALFEPQAAEMSTQSDLRCNQHKNKTEKLMEVTEKAASRSEKHFLFMNGLSYIGVTQKKEVIMQGVEETLSKGFEVGF